MFFLCKWQISVRQQHKACDVFHKSVCAYTCDCGSENMCVPVNKGPCLPAHESWAACVFLGVFSGRELSDIMTNVTLIICTCVETHTRKLAGWSSRLLRKQRTHSDELHLLLKRLNKQLLETRTHAQRYQNSIPSRSLGSRTKSYWYHRQSETKKGLKHKRNKS